MNPSITLNIHFAPGSCGHKVIRKGKRPKHAKTTRLPRITRLMALSIKYDRLITQGLITRHQELADLAGVDRSLISDILRMRLLAPDIQEWLLNLAEQEQDTGPVSRSELRELTRMPSWEVQRHALEGICRKKEAKNAYFKSTASKRDDR